eukprot:6339617-Prymnesium_polylepis.1
MRVRAVVQKVLDDPDLVGLILAGNVGPSTFAVVSSVCKTWLSVCRVDMRVLRGVAQYQGALTKGALTKLFAISSQEADALPRTSHKRYSGGMYFLYQMDAIDSLLSRGGMQEWQRRLKERGKRAYPSQWLMHNVSIQHASQQEERLHARALQRQIWRSLVST